MEKLKDIKLNIKPIVFLFHHEYVYEGPCRSGNPDMLTKEYDLAKGEKLYARQLETFDTELGGIEYFNLLEPLCVDSADDFLSLESTVQEMISQDEITDVYLIVATSRNCELALMLAQRVNKPLVFTPSAYPMMDMIISSMHARGLHNGYNYLSWDATRKCLESIRAYKIVHHMRILCLGRFGSERNGSAIDNFADYEEVSRKLGVSFVFANIHEYLDQTHPFDSGKNYTLPGRDALNPTEKDMDEIYNITDQLIANADVNEMDREEVMRSVRAYYVVEKMLKAYECNAFMAICPDACATRRLNDERFTFCLTHSLHHILGIPSACEYDGPACVSMAILGALGHKPTFMGNTTHQLYFGDGVGTRGREIETDDSLPPNTIVTWHAVTNPLMHGFDQPASKYLLRAFAWSGFGVTMRCDFTPDVGQVVTMCRIDPGCSKMLVAKGVVAGGLGYDAEGCNIGLYLTVEDEEDFYQKQILVGNHIPLVYGDCFDEVCLAGKMLGLEVITA